MQRCAKADESTYSGERPMIPTTGVALFYLLIKQDEIVVTRYGEVFLDANLNKTAG